MQYILRIGPWHIGPFATHQAASHFAESHGCDDYTMIPMDDPAEAPSKIIRLRMAPLDHPMKKAPVAEASA
ncbi:MAG: hypothetical protein EBR73_17445 [Rhodobacteraceae bacterium]|jgi:hypothetical protein|nr:hypothetical protein [Paracoccaceae bacterium]